MGCRPHRSRWARDRVSRLTGSMAARAFTEQTTRSLQLADSIVGPIVGPNAAVPGRIGLDQITMRGIRFGGFPGMKVRNALARRCFTRERSQVRNPPRPLETPGFGVMPVEGPVPIGASWLSTSVPLVA
jgi:hypothetical protein